MVLIVFGTLFAVSLPGKYKTFENFILLTAQEKQTPSFYISKHSVILKN